MIPAGTAPELRLLLACARLHLQDGDREDIAAVRSLVDWRMVSRLADWHGLRPLMHRHLGEDESVPRDVRVALWAHAHAIERRNRGMQEELGRVCDALSRAGIPAVAFKGPTLAVRALGDVALREFGDLDLLVPRAEVVRARELLCGGAGYGCEYRLAPAAEAACIASPTQYHLVLRSRTLGHRVELHWKTDPDFPLDGPRDAAWWTRASPPALDDDELVLLLLLHGCKHLWASLGWLVDVAELLRGGIPVDWERLRRRALAMNAATRVGLGLRLAHELLGAPLPRGARELAFASGTRGWEALRARLLLPEPPAVGTLQSLPMQWALLETRPQRLRMVFNAIFRPSLEEWTRWRLPRPLFFAYPALRLARLAAKYLGRGLESASGGRKLQS